MSRNGLYAIIAALAGAVLVVGYQLYVEQQDGIRIDIGKQGVSIEGK
ncbi:MAG: hypothetical protein WAT78_10640 [Rhizobiaceae bacterium]